MSLFCFSLDFTETHQTGGHRFSEWSWHLCARKTFYFYGKVTFILRAENLLLSFSLLRRKKGGSAWIESTLWSHRISGLVNLVFLNWFCQCEHPFTDKTDGYYWARCTVKNQGGGLGWRLYPGNMQHALDKDLTRFMQSLSQERQNRASKRKALLAVWVTFRVGVIF